MPAFLRVELGRNGRPGIRWIGPQGIPFEGAQYAYNDDTLAGMLWECGRLETAQSCACHRHDVSSFDALR